MQNYTKEDLRELWGYPSPATVSRRLKAVKDEVGFSLGRPDIQDNRILTFSEQEMGLILARFPRKEKAAIEAELVEDTELAVIQSFTPEAASLTRYQVNHEMSIEVSNRDANNRLLQETQAETDSVFDALEDAMYLLGNNIAQTLFDRAKQAEIVGSHAIAAGMSEKFQAGKKEDSINK